MRKRKRIRQYNRKIVLMRSTIDQLGGFIKDSNRTIKKCKKTIRFEEEMIKMNEKEISLRQEKLDVLLKELNTENRLIYLDEGL